ncbi:MAG: 7-cyano-7-deazaguanine synthase QueC [Promethearchaeota archaeon]
MVVETVVDAKDKVKAVVLCSGGLDSTTALHIAISEGFDVYPISFNYKQRHSIELQFARKSIEKLGLTQRWVVFNLDFSQIQASALTDDSLTLPVDRKPDEMAGEIPISYVPLRNTIFLSYAAAYAETKEITDIFIGVNALDYSGYPDCRPEYIKAMEASLTLGSRYVDDPSKKYRLHVPLINLTKAEIIRKGRSLGVDYSLTWSCYNPKVTDGKIFPCGSCDSCILRAKGFQEV